MVGGQVFRGSSGTPLEGMGKRHKRTTFRSEPSGLIGHGRLRAPDKAPKMSPCRALHDPFTAATGVRIRLGTPFLVTRCR
jgi:hypothetical protein